MIILSRSLFWSKIMKKQYHQKECNYCGKKLLLFEGKTILSEKNKLVICGDCFRIS
jgi:hypothetical protein